MNFNSIIPDIQKHATAALPKECCGFATIVRGKLRYIPANNIANNNEDFIVDPQDIIKAESLGTIVAIVHSHTGYSAKATDADIVSCKISKLPWIIVAQRTGAYTINYPDNLNSPPLVGRNYTHGVTDCFSIIQDYYRETLGINLETPYREDLWWHKGANLYLDNAASWGFTEVTLKELAIHDVILMKFDSNVPNHGAVYLGGNKILHHPYGRLSTIDIYGDYYRKITTNYMRYTGVTKNC